jgi:acyl carrier protein
MLEDEIYQILREALREFDVDPTSVVPSANLEDDLGLDSLDRLTAMVVLEDRFGVSLSGLEKAGTVGEAVDMVLSRLS